MQGWVRGLAFGGSLAAALMLASAAGCGDDDDGGGGRNGPDLPEATPGELNFDIQGVELPETGAPVVTFRVTDRTGAPIDLIQEIKNGATSPAVRPSTSPPRFTLAQLEDDGDYVSYYERAVPGKKFIPSEGAAAVDPQPGSPTQAVSDNVPTDATLEQRLTAVEGQPGVYRYQLSAPSKTGLDRTKTHTAAMWATRTLATPEDPGHPANASFNFRPGGGTEERFETVTDAACNTCHGQLEAHDRRTGVQLCLTCHSPQSTDPETGNTVDMKVMIHRIHMGASLPSVEEGGTYRIVGFAPGNPATLPATAVHDFSHFVFPRPVSDCTACHQGEDADRWKTVANVTACNSCHDNVRFDGSAGAVCAPGVTEPCNHAGGRADVATTDCTTCHTQNEITSVHRSPLVAGADQFRYELVSASVGPDRKPIVDFRVVDPTRQNTAYDIKTAAPFTQGGGASSLTVDVAWAPEEFSNEGSVVRFGQPIAMNALTTATPVEGQPGVFRVTSSAPQSGGPAPTVPEGVTAITVMIEGHPVLGGQRIPVTTLTQNVALGGGAEPPARRTIVTTEKCNACHGWLTAHGANRNNNVLACAVCHNANATDKNRRPAGNTGEESVDLKVLIHEVHGVGVRENPVTIFGFGNTPHTFPLGLGNVANCNVCHEGTSYMVPLPAESLATTLTTGADPAATGDNTRRPPTQAACISCHDTAVDHALQYTTQAGVERCAECHGAGESLDVSEVHPVTTRPGAAAP